MTKPDLRLLQGEEFLEILYPLTSYAFHPSPPLEDKEKWLERIKNRQGMTSYAIFEEDIPVATVSETRMTQNVRGKQMGMGGVWGVATQPNARRKGYAKNLMKKLLTYVYEDGRAISCLYPFRESFYERLGYVTFPNAKEVNFKPDNLDPLLKKDLGGTVKMSSIKEGYEEYAKFLRKIQRQTHGMALPKIDDQLLAKENKNWLALAKVKGKIVGAMVYALKGKEVTKFKFRATRFYYTTSQGKYLLLSWIAKHVDQANEAVVFLPPFEKPETWLSDLSAKIKPLWIPPMARVVDVAKLEGLQTGPGRFSAKITDPFCPWNENTWKFKSADGVLEVKPAPTAAFTLSIQALSALVYGTHNVEDFSFRGWGNPSPAEQETLRTLFPPQAPFMHLFF